jgi:excisionase family DNA binding protein
MLKEKEKENIENPFEIISNQLEELKVILLNIREDMSDKKKNKYYSLQQAANILQVSFQTVRRNIRRGNINASQIGSKTLIKNSELYNDENDIKSVKNRRF